MKSMNVWRFRQESPAMIGRSKWRSLPNSDILEGLQFCATMQQRTPLRVLIRHGEIFMDLPNDPPAIARAIWEGIWLPKPRSFHEMGIDLPEPLDGQMASSVGIIPADGGNYLKYLITIRKIVETANSIEDRIRDLIAEVTGPRWIEFTHHHLHGPHDIADCFFPRFLHCVPKLSFAAIEKLEYLGLNSPLALDQAMDSDLLAIRGIGPKVLCEIRIKCAAATSDRVSVRVDRVHR